MLCGRRRIEELPEAEVVRLYRDEGLSLTELARRLGWSPSAIYSRMVELGIARRSAWATKAVGVDEAELQRLYVEEKLSLSALAERYSCSLITVWRKLKAAGIECRPYGAVGLGVHRRQSLRQLCARIEPYLRHARRRHDMMEALKTC